MTKVVYESGTDEVTGDTFIEDVEGRIHFPGIGLTDAQADWLLESYYNLQNERKVYPSLTDSASGLFREP